MSSAQPSPNLASNRIAASLSADDLARKSGVSLRAILRAEHAAATKGGAGAVLSVDELVRISAVLGVSLSTVRGF